MSLWKERTIMIKDEGIWNWKTKYDTHNIPICFVWAGTVAGT
jgi:hypothetical protein